MKVRELFEMPDFVPGEMPTLSVGSTIDFYSEDTIKRSFDVLNLFDYEGKKVAMLMSKTGKFAVIGFMDERKEDKKTGLRITGQVEFKTTPNIAYDRDVPIGKEVLQVDGVEVPAKHKEKGYGSLLYLSLIKYVYVLISDNLQYAGGKALWKKMAKLSGVDYQVYVIENGKPLLDKNGEPKTYDGTNIDDAKIWSAPGKAPKTSKRYTLLLLRKKAET